MEATRHELGERQCLRGSVARQGCRWVGRQNMTFMILVRSMSEVGSVRVRNVWVLGCIPGEVDKRGGQ